MQPLLVDRRVLTISLIAVVLGALGAVVARALVALIGLFTNLAFYGRVSLAFVSPAGNHLGLWVVAVPVVGAVIVGFMARYGSEFIRGHGIPEAMEAVLVNESRIAPRVAILKPLSAALAIGTGGPFGAEGPIIATGGSLGSVVGQLIKTSPSERATLLAAGAAAGMAATFGSPVSSVLLAVELLVFEYRPRSLIPVCMAAVTAAAIRIAIVGAAPMFAMSSFAAPGIAALGGYVILGALVGVASVGATRAVYLLEEGFGRLPLHWMWWPALGAVAVGVIGYLAPHTMGVGYDEIVRLMDGRYSGNAALALAVLKMLSWTIALSSGTSGGTLAPLFIIGGGLGAWLGACANLLMPGFGLDARLGALVGMAAMFAGASRAVLTSTIFALETTGQPLALLPVLGGCGAAFFVSCALMRDSIMTEKVSRRGLKVPAEYEANFLDLAKVRDWAHKPLITLRAGDSVAATRQWLESGTDGSRHQGFPVLDENGHLVGVLTRYELGAAVADEHQRIAELIKRPPIAISEEASLNEAANLMAAAAVGRLPVVSRSDPHQAIGIITRSDIMAARKRHLERMGTNSDQAAGDRM